MTRSRRLPASQPSPLLFSAALIASALAHALLLLDLPSPERWLGSAIGSDPRPIIINLQPNPATQPPQQALRFAEQDSDGSGNTTQANQHSTSVPLLQATESGDEPPSDTEPNTRLLTRADSQVRIEQTEPSREQQPVTPNSTAAPAQPEGLTALQSEPAERQHDAETGPSKAVHGRSAKGLAWARYALDWQSKMERFGTYYFPEQLHQQQLYGGPVLTVEINADGTLAAVRIARSSGQTLLDQAAQKIVRMAAPFAPFPPALASKYRSWEITRRWVFTDDNRLSTQ